MGKIGGFRRCYRRSLRPFRGNFVLHGARKRCRSRSGRNLPPMLLVGNPISPSFSARFSPLLFRPLFRCGNIPLLQFLPKFASERFLRSSSLPFHGWIPFLVSRLDFLGKRPLNFSFCRRFPLLHFTSFVSVSLFE